LCRDSSLLVSGFELVKQLLPRSNVATVVATVRGDAGELASVTNSKLRLETGVDIAKLESLQALADRLRAASVKIDVLIVNAGVLYTDKLPLDSEAIAHALEMYAVNSLGPLLTAQTLAPLLADGGKLGIVSSRVGSIAETDTSQLYGYRMSKAAVNIAGKCLSVELKPRRIAVIVLHPGFVRTALTGGKGNINADESAGGLLQRVDELTLENTGIFKHAQGQTLPW